MLNLRFALSLSVSSLFLLLMASSASAHRPNITAEAVCDLETNLIVINYVSTAWGGFPNDPASRQNSQVDILRDGPPRRLGRL